MHVRSICGIVGEKRSFTVYVRADKAVPRALGFDRFDLRYGYREFIQNEELHKMQPGWHELNWDDGLPRQALLHIRDKS